MICWFKQNAISILIYRVLTSTLTRKNEGQSRCYKLKLIARATAENSEATMGYMDAGALLVFGLVTLHVVLYWQHCSILSIQNHPSSQSLSIAQINVAFCPSSFINSRSGSAFAGCFDEFADGDAGAGAGVSSAGTGAGAGVSSAGTGSGAGVSSAGAGAGAGVSSAGAGAGAGVSSAGTGAGAGVPSAGTGAGVALGALGDFTFVNLVR